jgi:ribosomal protein S18 acetylase RimI-like enzyme
VHAGAFALLHAADPSLSHAAPLRRIDDAGELRAEIASATAALQARGLRPRFELSMLLWPELPPLLGEAGFRLEEQTPLLVCAAASFLPRGGAVRWVRADEDLAYIGSVMRQGLEIRGGPPTAGELAALRAHLASGLRLAYAEIDGRPAATGCSFPIGATTEISTLSTIPTQRRRGAARAVASFLAAEHFAAGGELAWAATDDPRAHGLLQSLGFDDAGPRVSYGLP